MAESRTISFDELSEHTKREDLYVLIHGKVYAVSKFLDEHPGGDEVILAEAGKDATEAFEDVGHSDEARDILKTLLVGVLDSKDAKVTSDKPKANGPGAAPAAQAASNMSYFIPLTVLVAYFAWRFYSSGSA